MKVILATVCVLWAITIWMLMGSADRLKEATEMGAEYKECWLLTSNQLEDQKVVISELKKRLSEHEDD
jgi:hypothetical protein